MVELTCEQNKNLDRFKDFLKNRGFIFPLNLTKLKDRFSTYSGGEKTMIIFVLNNIYGIRDKELLDIDNYNFHRNNFGNLDEKNSELINDYKKDPYEF